MVELLADGTKPHSPATAAGLDNQNLAEDLYGTLFYVNVHSATAGCNTVAIDNGQRLGSTPSPLVPAW